MTEFSRTTKKLMFPKSSKFIHHLINTKPIQSVPSRLWISISQRTMFLKFNPDAIARVKRLLRKNPRPFLILSLMRGQRSAVEYSNSEPSDRVHLRHTFNCFFFFGFTKHHQQRLVKMSDACSMLTRDDELGWGKLIHGAICEIRLRKQKPTEIICFINFSLTLAFTARLALWF